MSGYSKTPLLKKLGIKPGYQIFVKNSPVNYADLVSLTEGEQIKTRLVKGLDMIHFFTKSRSELEKNLSLLSKKIKPAGMIWVSWPKKASKVDSDVTEGVIRDLALSIGMVDIKVCAVDETWSGLKLVIRKENR